MVISLSFNHTGVVIFGGISVNKNNILHQINSSVFPEMQICLSHLTNKQVA